MPRTKSGSRLFGHLRRHLFAGVLTVVPLWVTWLVFKFIFEQLSHFGAPSIRALSKSLRPGWPTFAEWLLDPVLQSLLAVLLILFALVLIGWLATWFVGARILAAFDTLMTRIPGVQAIYGSVRKLIAVLQDQPESMQRVVLIPFPSPEMRTVGFVTRVFRDPASGEELAAVYVPTTPNPTSGYLEIVPNGLVTETDWSVDQAMTFIMSGGAVAPERLSFTAPDARRANDDPAADATRRPPGDRGAGA
jgi:uncharacterized membrane protein